MSAPPPLSAELRAKYNNLAASGAALAAVLEGNKTITSADLSRNEMGDETMVAVAKMLEKNTGSIAPP